MSATVRSHSAERFPVARSRKYKRIIERPPQTLRSRAGDFGLTRTPAHALALRCDPATALYLLAALRREFGAPPLVWVARSRSHASGHRLTAPAVTCSSSAASVMLRCLAAASNAPLGQPLAAIKGGNLATQHGCQMSGCEVARPTGALRPTAVGQISGVLPTQLTSRMLASSETKRVAVRGGVCASLLHRVSGAAIRTDKLDASADPTPSSLPKNDEATR
jgi:hypothetical protein